MSSRLEAAPRHELDVPRPERLGALRDDRRDDGLAVTASARRARRPLRDVAVAPLHEREQRDAELRPLLGQPVLVALGALAVANPLEDPLLDEPGEPVREHVARDAEALLELVEAADAEEGVADDEQCPALADELER